MIKKISRVLGVLLFIIYIIITIVLQLNNFDMTEARLLITYWWFYISVVIPVGLILYGGLE